MLLYTLTLAVLVAGALGGVLHPRVIGGEETTIDKHPHQISIEYKNETTEEYGHFCSGSIISKDWVLTGAPCVAYFNSTNERLRIRVGSSFVGKRAEGDLHDVSQIIIHPKYEFWVEYSIAVLKVAEPFKFSEKVKPITMVSETPAGGSPAVVTGWGWRDNVDQDQLLQTDVKIIDIDTCNEHYGFLLDITVCADAIGDGIDGGRPLVYDGKLAGTISLSATSNSQRLPDVYANLAHFKDWVSSVTGLNS